MVKTLVVTCAAVVTLGSTASAQTRFFSGEITAGTITGVLNGREIGAQFDLAGPGFHVVGGVAEPGRLIGHHCRLEESFTCRPGTEVSLSSFWIGSPAGFLIVNGRVTVNGETLEPAAVEVRLFVLDADPVTIPKGNRKNVVLSTPFVLTSGVQPGSTVIQLRVYPGAAFLAEPWAVGEISGDGLVTGTYERSSLRSEPPVGKKIFYYVLQNIIYSFNAP